MNRWRKEQLTESIGRIAVEQYKEKEREKKKWEEEMKALEKTGYKFCPLIKNECLGKLCVAYKEQDAGFIPICGYFKSGVHKGIQ